MVRRTPAEIAKYYADNPDKLKAKLERDAKKKGAGKKPAPKKAPAKKQAFAMKKTPQSTMVSQAEALASLSPFIHKSPPRSNTSEGNFTTLNLQTQISPIHRNINGRLFMLVNPNSPVYQRVLIASQAQNWAATYELSALNTEANTPQEARCVRAGIQICNFTKATDVEGVLKVLVLNTPTEIEFLHADTNSNYALSTATMASLQSLLEASDKTQIYPAHKFIDKQEIILPVSTHIHYSEYKKWDWYENADDTIDFAGRKTAFREGLKNMGLCCLLVSFEPVNSSQTYMIKYQEQLLARYPENTVLNSLARQPVRQSFAGEQRQRQQHDVAQQAGQAAPVRRPILSSGGTQWLHSGEEEINIKKITDVEGLQKAYNNPNNIVVYGNTIFISGTHKNPYNRSGQYADWFDWWKIANQTVKNTNRYQQAKNMLSLYPNVNRIAAHSYGSILGQNLMEDNPHLRSATLYSAPIITGMKDKRIKYKSHNFDPAGLLTSTPERSYYGMGVSSSHSYRGFEPEYTEEEQHARHYDAQSRFIQRMEQRQALNIMFPDD